MLTSRDQDVPEKKINWATSSVVRFQWVGSMIISIFVIIWGIDYITTDNLWLLIQGYSAVGVIFSLILGSVYAYNRAKLNQIRQFSPEEKKTIYREYIRKFLSPQLAWGICFVLFRFF
ncbi:MAG: hypothetical protein K940chlam6_01636 [Chlamydiae bacterium]|nr:hypothetical protein [Chlamydiota bacterium]